MKMRTWVTGLMLAFSLQVHAELVLLGDLIEVPEDQANQETPPFLSNGHSLAMFSDGRFVVVWNERENFVPLARYRVFGADGLAVTPATKFNEGFVIPLAPVVTIPAGSQAKGTVPLFVTGAIVNALDEVMVQSFGSGGGAMDSVVFSTGVDNIDVSATVVGGLQGTVVAGLLTQEIEFAGFSAKRTAVSQSKRLVSASRELAGTLAPTGQPFELRPEVQRFDEDGFLGEALIIQDPMAGFFNSDLAFCGDTAAFMYVAANPGFMGDPNPVLALVNVGVGGKLSLINVSRDTQVPSAVAVSVTCSETGLFASAVGAPQPAGPLGRGEAQAGIVVRGFTSTGVPIGAGIIPRTAPTGGLVTSIAINEQGAGVVVWSDVQAQDPDNQGVYVQRFQLTQSDFIFSDNFEGTGPIE